MFIGDLKATRKSIHDSKETEHSVIIVEAETLSLYCNYSGLEPESDIAEVPFLTVTWFKGKVFQLNFNLRDLNLFWSIDGENIQQSLESMEGEFQNFTRIAPYEFQGPVKFSHRGEYSCSINITENYFNSSFDSSRAFPMEFTFFVRVRGNWF